jgi:hypothetical protein
VHQPVELHRPHVSLRDGVGVRDVVRAKLERKDRFIISKTRIVPGSPQA